MRVERSGLLVVFVAVLSLVAGTARAATPTRIGATPLPTWEKWQVSADREITAFVARGPIERAPLVVLLQGSPCHPLFRLRSEGGRQRTQITLPFVEAIARHDLPQHFVAFDRRGLTSFDGGEAAKESRACTLERGGVDKAERVRDTIAVIRAFRELPWVTEVWLAGHSEGADVATGVVRAAPGLAHVVGLFAGAGPSQFFDDVHRARSRLAPADAEQTFRDLDAFTSGQAPTEYDGHPSARFITYAVASTALDDVNASPEVPIFIAHGTADTHMEIASADLFVVEAMRQHKDRPLRYLVVDGAGHGFETRDDDVQREVLSDFTRWAASGPHGRSFATIGVPPALERRSVTRYFGVRDRVWFIGLPCAGVVALGVFAANSRRARRRVTSTR